ncbi:MAG: Slp family lipoprotein [Thermodesulfobacteriota bacterium]
MQARIGPLWIWALVLILFSGCSVVSKNLRQEAITDDTSFAAIQRNTSAYEGNTVIFGGYILKTRNLADQTRLVVLQAPLGHRDQPEARDKSGGRFMVVDDGFLDPAVYKKGRKITVAGKVLGRQTAKIGEFTYEMPKIKAREIHLWQKRQDPPAYYYDPYYPRLAPYYRYRYGPYPPYRW